MRTKRRLAMGVQESFPGCDYTPEEREFLQAIDRYKRSNGGRPYPSWREVLNVLKALGYRKPDGAGQQSGAN